MDERTHEQAGTDNAAQPELDLPGEYALGLSPERVETLIAREEDVRALFPEIQRIAYNECRRLGQSASRADDISAKVALPCTYYLLDRPDKNEYLERYVKRATRRELGEASGQTADAPLPSDDLLQENASAPSPLDAMIEATDAELAWEQMTLWLGRLPFNRAAAFLLRQWDFAYEDIAIRLGPDVNIDQVRQWVHRDLESLTGIV